MDRNRTDVKKLSVQLLDVLPTEIRDRLRRFEIEQSRWRIDWRLLRRLKGKGEHIKFVLWLDK